MKKENSRMFRGGGSLLVLGIAATLFLNTQLKVNADSFEHPGNTYSQGSPYEYGNITMSPVGGLAMYSAGDKNWMWYKKGLIADENIPEPTGGALREYEHYYKSSEADPIHPVYLEVGYSDHMCIHTQNLNIAPNIKAFLEAEGMHYLQPDTYWNGRWDTAVQRRSVTYIANFEERMMKEIPEHYKTDAGYSGWAAYCVNCGEIIQHWIYGSQGTMSKLHYMDDRIKFGYICPYDGNPEQLTFSETHYCNAVSKNKYFVWYNGNGGNGIMGATTHMWDNTELYDGQEIIPDTKLRKSTFWRTGYQFTGWNTKPDGTGTHYDDEQEVLNLTPNNNENIYLYAQWEVSTSTLNINPNQGKYNGSTNIVTLSGSYSSVISIGRPTPPNGVTVHFVTNNGVNLGDIIQPMSFKSWAPVGKLNGKFNTEQTEYTFLGNNGTSDEIKAQYEGNEITLPSPGDNGEKRFSGWYSDPTYSDTSYVGREGNKVIPGNTIGGQVTYYAKWDSLRLISKDNYIANDKKGACDLSWYSGSTSQETYKLFQREESGDWKRVSLANDISGAEPTVPAKVYNKEDNNKVWVVPYTGIYQLEVAGAKGGDYSDHKGGKGGKVQGNFYLEAGDELTLKIGDSSGTYGGAKVTNGFSYGGGYSLITSKQIGTLLIAGGGGGASVSYDGYGAGLGDGLTGTASLSGSVGQSGYAGGGGGYRAGGSGAVILHDHTSNGCTNHVHNSSCYRAHSHNNSCYIRYIQVTWSRDYSSDCGNQCTFGYYHWRCTYPGCGHECDTTDHFVNGTEGTCPTHGNWWSDAGDGHCGHDNLLNCNKVYDAFTCTVCPENQSGWLCGKDDSYVEDSYPSYGGSNYINAARGRNTVKTADTNTGDGYIKITGVMLGFTTAQKLDGALATDHAKPDPVVLNKKGLSTGTDIQVYWDEPKDNGTVYYHYVESWLVDAPIESVTYLLQSNITQNTLTSGIKGYYYNIRDNSPLSTFNENSEDWVFTTNRFLNIPLKTVDQYVSVVVGDVAGNFSDIRSIKIVKYSEGAPPDEELSWAVHTLIMGIDYTPGVYQKPGASSTYYVKADGKTAINLGYDSKITDLASNTYQINGLGYVVTVAGDISSEEQIIEIYAENHIPYTENSTYKSLAVSMNNQKYMIDASNTVANRTNNSKYTKINKSFSVLPEHNGKTLRVKPQVYAVNKVTNETVYSIDSEDIANSIYLIADAQPPYFVGSNSLKEIQDEWLSSGYALDATYASKTVTISAKDDLSGLDNFVIVIKNIDNFIEETYTCDESGKVTLNITPEDPLFRGDWEAVLIATDNVGNVYTEEYLIREFTLDAWIENPNDPEQSVGNTTFRSGQTALLRVKTTGFVEKITVDFLDIPGLSVSYEYPGVDPSKPETFPAYQKDEDYYFVIPLYVEVGAHDINVAAYKSRKDSDGNVIKIDKLNVTPRLDVISIADDPVTEDLTSKWHGNN